MIVGDARERFPAAPSVDPVAAAGRTFALDCRQARTERGTLRLLMLQCVEERMLSACAALAGDRGADPFALRPRLRQKHRGLSLNPGRGGVRGPGTSLIAKAQHKRGFQVQGNRCHAENCEPP